MIGYSASAEKADSESVRVHLLMSVFVTNKALVSNKKSQEYNRETLRLEQFLSTVHSISRLKTSSQDFYIQFDDEFSEYEGLVVAWLRNLYPQSHIYEFRLSTYNEWKKASSKIPNDSQLILLQTNFDHPFIAAQSHAFNYFSEDLVNLGERVIGEITHWPEALGNLFSPWGSLKTNTQISHAFIGECKQTIGTCLVSKNLFKEWWVHDFTKGAPIIRPDNPFGPNIFFPVAIYAVPKLELFRHLDGYDLAYIKSPWARGFRPCCNISQKGIFHTNWTHGNLNYSKYSKTVAFDLPLVQSYSETKPFTVTEQFVNLINVACAHRININAIKELYSYYSKLKTNPPVNVYIELIKNRHFLRRLPRLILDRTLGSFLFTIYRFFSFKSNFHHYDSIFWGYISSFGWHRTIPKLMKRFSLGFYSWVARKLSARVRSLMKEIYRNMHFTSQVR